MQGRPDFDKELAREPQLAELDAAIELGIADADAGRTIDAESMFDELIEQYSSAVRAT